MSSVCVWTCQAQRSEFSRKTVPRTRSLDGETAVALARPGAGTASRPESAEQRRRQATVEIGWQYTWRYSVAISCWHARTAVLKTIRCRIGSQRRSRWIGFMLPSSGSCHHTTGNILGDLQPLQQLVANTSQQTVATVQSIDDKSKNKCLVRIRRQLPCDQLSRRRWKKQDLLSAAIRLAMVRSLSSRSPRSLMPDENGTMAFCSSSVWTMTLSNCWRVPS